MIGKGFVGLLSEVCYAGFRHELICIDKDVAEIEMLKFSKVPTFKPYLENLIFKNVRVSRLKKLLKKTICDRLKKNLQIEKYEKTQI